MSELQRFFLYSLLGLSVFWIVFIGYELYLRASVKCINCIVENPGRLRFFKRFSLITSILCGLGTIVFWMLDSYMVFVTFILVLYFLRLFMLARSRYEGLLKEDERGEYNPNIPFHEDIQETLAQFKLLVTSPRRFFNQNKN